MTVWVKFYIPIAYTLIALGSYLGVPAQAEPTIRFTVIPPYDQGGSETSAYVQGTVVGVKNPQDYCVVLWAKSDRWYIQPELDNYCVGIHDGTWSADIHTGTRYAALLVLKNSKFNPRSPTGVRPSFSDPGVVSETEVEGKKDETRRP